MAKFALTHSPGPEGLLEEGAIIRPRGNPNQAPDEVDSVRTVIPSPQALSTSTVIGSYTRFSSPRRFVQDGGVNAPAEPAVRVTLTHER